MDSTERKKKYALFCAAHPELPIFYQAWWLDTVCYDGQWDVAIYEDNGGNIWGVLPYFQKRHYAFFQVISMPILTPYLGPWIIYPKDRKDRFGFEKKVMDELMAQLPSVVYSRQDFHYTVQNWLPFFWQGFDQSTVYTFRIEEPNSVKEVFDSFKPDVKNKIRKAEKLLSIETTDDLELFYQLNQATFERQKLGMPYSFAFIQQFDQVLQQKEARTIYIAKNQKGEAIAGVYLVQDQHCIYNLMLGAKTSERNSGAIQLLLWQGLQLALNSNKSFDFEGSMLPGVAPIFNGFGSTLIPYHRVSKGKNKLFKLLKVLLAKW